MPAPTIGPLPTPPSRSQAPDTFSADSDAFLAGLPDFRTDANAQASYLDALAAIVDGYAAAALVSQNAAAASETAAAGSALAAANSADASQDSAGASAASALEAAGLVESYQGALAADPTLDKNGNALAAGDWYINTVTGFIRAYTGTEWTQGISSVSGVSSLNGLVGDLTGFVTEAGIQSISNKTIAFADNTLAGVAPLASPSFTGTAEFTATKSVSVAVSASAIDCSAGNYFTKTAAGARSWTVTNVPATGAFSFILELTNGGTGTQTWFTGIKWPGGTAPTLTASGVDLLGFITDDGGTTWRGVQLMKDSK